MGFSTVEAVNSGQRFSWGLKLTLNTKTAVKRAIGTKVM
jgi:hypothetical protein